MEEKKLKILSIMVIFIIIIGAGAFYFGSQYKELVDKRNAILELNDLEETLDEIADFDNTESLLFN